MSISRTFALAACLSAAVVLGACGSDDSGGAIDSSTDASTSVSTPAGDGSTDASADGSATVGMANPASVNCVDKGGKEATYSNADGEFGVCEFPDGTECESWKYFRGECKPGDHQEAPERKDAEKVR